MYYINLSRKSDISFSLTFEIVQRTITLGRHVSNNIRLYCSDENVGPIHAELYNDRDNYFIVDRGSGSGTYMDKVKLVKNRSYLLSEGVPVSIGEYTVKFFLKSPGKNAAGSEMQTIKNAINYLDDALIYLDTVRMQNPVFYDKKIKKELDGILEIPGNKKLRSLLMENHNADVNRSNKDSIDSCEKPDFIVDMFLKLFIEFHAMSENISNEFIETHTVHRRDSQQLILPERLKKYILDSELSADEKEKRIKFLWNKIEDLISTHSALFAGYKNSIRYGTKDLLKELDPVAIIDNAGKKNQRTRSSNLLRRYLPFLMCQRNLKSIIDKYESLSHGMEMEIESKYFQPAFKSGYLQKVNSEPNSSYDPIME